ncbi:hypothetical protein OAM32_03885 [Alphaproteobacteria bacterium]|nr:hypothetical protein [Alphaproteobacteria bacterium]
MTEKREPQHQKKHSESLLSIQNIYLNCRSFFLKSAASGWLFTTNFEAFFCTRKTQQEIKRPSKSKKYNQQKRLSQLDSTDRPEKILESLFKEKSLKTKFAELSSLAISNNPSIVMDSFIKHRGNSIITAQKSTFAQNKLNIVILGAGITGLYLANLYKERFREAVNILVFDNRSKNNNIRQPFDRSWLTHINIKMIQKNTAADITELLGCFGSKGWVGLPINLLEALLMLSCKKQGVKFYFSPRINYSKIKNPLISLFFDATGGKFDESISLSDTCKQLEVEVPHLKMNFRSSGIQPLKKNECTNATHMNFVLNAGGKFHFPHIEGYQLITRMIKLEKVPISFSREIFDFFDKYNADNLFYFWKGDLQSEINEALIFITLTEHEYDDLISTPRKKLSTNELLNVVENSSTTFDERIIQFLKILGVKDLQNRVKIGPPFMYKPYINLNAGMESFNGKKIFPIGDSIFCGHPKYGNGLTNHIKFINYLVEQTSAK